jgi:CelD/BcsL family acetyltransferase involved in cellulose biosynthesis
VSHSGTPAETVEIVREPARFEALREPWNVLAAAAGTPLARHEWYAAALEAHAGAVDVHMPVLWRNGRMAAAAPFALERAGGARRLTPLDAFAYEPDRLLYSDEAALGRVVAALRSSGWPLLVRALPAGGPEAAAFAAARRRRDLVLRRGGCLSAALDMSPGFADLERRMSGNRRSALRRKTKAAERAFGAVRLELVTLGPAQAGGFLADLFRIEGSGWKGAQGTSIAADERMRRFVTAVGRAFAAAGVLRGSRLLFGEHLAAVRLVAISGGAAFELKIGYDESLASFAPGLVSMHETLRALAADGVGRYEFLGVYETWQDYWPRELRDHEAFRTYPAGVPGLTALLADASREAGRRLAALRR